MKTISEEYKKLASTSPESFIEQYSCDDRKSVQALVEKAKKAILEREKELARVGAMYQFDSEVAGVDLIAGVDEVGRGPLAGPVVTACVILNKDKIIPYINDSKKLTKAKREELYEIITNNCIAYSIGINDEKVIDDINILQATLQAMSHCVNAMEIKPEFVIADAVTIPNIDIPQRGVIKGDAKSAAVAAASIVAKVTRDRMMEEYAKIYPEYGFDSNMGYGSASHIEALKTVGPCPIHRRTFIKNFV